MAESNEPMPSSSGAPIFNLGKLGAFVGSFESMEEDDAETLTAFQAPAARSFTTSVHIDPSVRDTLFGIPVRKLPREERPAMARWQEIADERLSGYVRSAERYYPDEKPGHAIVLDETNELGNVTKRIWMPEAHIERLRGNEFSISTARSWVNWTPRLALRAARRAALRPKRLLRTFPRIRRLMDRRARRG